ncbi:MAG TPA: amino acid adenylation domain-containing protein, partial [Blastocatellia bacterium]
NDCEADYPDSSNLHQMIRDQAHQSPERIAAVFEDRQLTFSELDVRSNKLARYLSAKGARAESAAGICLERSLEMVIGLLGILKAGTAYVPLEPSYPPARLMFAIENSAIDLVVTEERFAPSLRGSNCGPILIDADWSEIEAEEPSAPEGIISHQCPAHIIYTSGSTGTPKGVINTHAGVCNRLAWMQTEMNIGTDDAVLQKTPFTFDVSVWEFFWPLITGARLVLAEPGGHRDNSYLADLITTQGVTTLHFVPSMLNLFIESGALPRCSSLRQVVSSGEALPVDLQERFRSASPSHLYNLYGPTEAAIDVTSWLCQDRFDNKVPIGRPIDNTAMGVLDGYGQTPPIGIQGELYIAGSGLARCYASRPDLTAERFLPSGFTSRPGNRMYRTGDLGRYLPDGNIEYLGRMDYQVKIRGFRVELSEIEARLRTHSAVKEACAVVLPDKAGGRRIVGYVVLAAYPKTTIRDLREFMLAEVPEYMVPSVFVIVESMPLGSTGKLDRRALPLPDGARPEFGRTFAPACTPTEVALTAIWEELLKIDCIGIHDDFFELGGHSLLMTQVLSRLRDRLELEVPIQTFFRKPTIADLANEVTKVRAAASRDDEVKELLDRIDQLTDAEIEMMLAQG